MKRIFTIIGLGVLFSFSSCFVENEGPRGPQGPQGVQGPQGIQGEPGESAYVMEWENVSFTSPDYEVFLNYSDFSFEGLDSDVALVYLLWNEGDVIWRALPQTILTTDGILQYNFDFTKDDVRLFLDAEFNLDLLTAIDTDGWVARVVVVPGDFFGSGRVDTSDYYEVAKALGLPDLDRDSSLKNK